MRLRFGEHQRVGHAHRERAHAAHLLGSAISVGGSSSAAWPVSAMNTSSSVGRRSAMSSIADAGVVEPPHRLGDHAASARAPARVTMRSSSVGRSSAHLRQRGDRALGVVARRSSVDLEPLAADAVLELVGGALGDHACRGRSPRSGRRAGRPRRGTGSSAARSCRPPRAPRSSPTCRAGCAGRGRSSARRGTAPAGGTRARRRGRAGGACRPSRSCRAAWRPR